MFFGIRTMPVIDNINKAYLINNIMNSFIKKLPGGILRLIRKKRSVIFFRHSYYHFYYLAQALRKRGWNAILVNLEDPEGPNANYFHGEDINLFSHDHVQFRKNIEDFFIKAKKEFELFHFAGDGYLCFFPEYTQHNEPPDIVEWKKLNKMVAYTVSGCNSGISQTSLSRWSALDNGKSVCNTCIWQSDSKVCSDQKNLDWGKKVEKYCDLICAEVLPAIDYMDLPNKIIREPLSMCLDPTFWHPDLKIPTKYYVKRQPGELLVYHAMGNYDSRNKNGRNIKGTSAVIAAIEQLKLEGMPIKLIFLTNIKNTEIRFMQAQADVIVDQLNFGRYGATAREGMMLGKPVICYIDQKEIDPKNELSCLKEVPLVSATEETVYEVLKDLLLNRNKRERIGKLAREYALKWHSADRCAERYEVVYDALMAGLPFNNFNS